MMTEEKIVRFIADSTFENIPQTMMEVVKKQVLAITGTTIGGSGTEGCENLVNMAKELGGKKEASILIYGGKVPAGQAAFLNGTMARALDFCDALAPGPHIGAATIPSALAAAELKGGCSGKEFLTAVATASEVAVRLNLSESQYGGFDPTKVLVVFSSTAAAAKVLGLSETEIWNALGLAFNQCGGSFQSHIDGSLGAKINQGWIAETGVTCARLAAQGITGPKNFLEGVYGYFHLFGRDQVSGESVTEGLGKVYHLDKIVFKLFPSCALTQLGTEVALNLVAEEKLDPADIKHIEVSMPPYAYNLVGGPFQPGSNPKVDAQFSIRYCIANALIRKSSLLNHFEEQTIKDPDVLELVKSIEVTADKKLDERGHTALDMKVLLNNGKQYLKTADMAPGFPGRPLTDEQHRLRFLNCINFSGGLFSKDEAENMINLIERLERLDDISKLISLLIVNKKEGRRHVHRDQE